MKMQGGKRRIGKERGAVLIYATFFALASASLITAMLSLSNSKGRIVETKGRKLETRYFAEGAIEETIQWIRNRIKNSDPPPLNPQLLDEFSHPNPADPFTWISTSDPDPLFTLSSQNWEGTDDPLLGIITSATVKQLVPQGVDADPQGGPPFFGRWLTPDDNGLQVERRQYEIEATARITDPANPNAVGYTYTAHRIINVDAASIFQFAVFYEGDLEILPGPSMTLGGRVHSNKDIYIGCSNTLTVDSNYMHTVGNIYRHRKNDPGVSDGTVLVRRWVEDPFNPMESFFEYFQMDSTSQMNSIGYPGPYDSAFTLGIDGNGDGDFLDYDLDGDGDLDSGDDVAPWIQGALEYWRQPDGYVNPAGDPKTGNTIMTGDHGVPIADAPDVKTKDMYHPPEPGQLADYFFDSSQGIYAPAAPGTGTHVKGQYFNDAEDPEWLNLSIINYPSSAMAPPEAFPMPDGSFVEVRKNGNLISPDDLPVGTITMSEFYDARQDVDPVTGFDLNTGDEITVIDIDLELLGGIDGGTNNFPTDGLLYAARYVPNHGQPGAGTATDVGGIRLKNGSELAGSLTVVTEGPLYVWGGLQHGTWD